MTIQIKRMVPITPVEHRGFKVPGSFEGLSEALTNLAGLLPLTVVEAPVPAGQEGIALCIAHQLLGWKIIATTGDWIVVGSDGNVEVFTDAIEDQFEFIDIPVEAVVH